MRQATSWVSCRIPERCAESVLGNQDGQLLFRSMIDAVMIEQDKKQTTS